MTIAQMGDAIADACKWTRDYNTESDFLYRTDDGRGMFNPAACLNAMHEAEKVLTEWQQGRWVELINRLQNEEARTTKNWSMLNPFWSVHATAAQRAEAFLRTINLWKP